MSDRRLLVAAVAVAVAVILLLLLVVPAQFIRRGPIADPIRTIITMSPSGGGPDTVLYNSSTAPTLSVATPSGGTVPFAALKFYTSVSVASDYPTFVVSGGTLTMDLLWIDAAGAGHYCGPRESFTFVGSQSQYPVGLYHYKPGPASGQETLAGGDATAVNEPAIMKTQSQITTYIANNNERGSGVVPACLQPVTGPVGYRYHYEFKFSVTAVGVGTVPSTDYVRGYDVPFWLQVGSITVTGGTVTS